MPQSPLEEKFENLAPFLSGEQLFGDNFNSAEISQWFADEKEGYADLGAKVKSTYKYKYHKLNRQHGFRHLGNLKFSHALGFGSAYGDEFRPLIKQIGKVSIIDSSDTFKVSDIEGVPVKFFCAEESGKLPFEDQCFDLITCLGVLHHIPNVSSVISELSRCLRKSGYLLVREPITSMGDWRKPRPGLTKRERGIPLSIFHSMINSAGLKVEKTTLCFFPPVQRLWNLFGRAAYNSSIAVFLDYCASRVFRGNYRYHRVSMVQKLAPAAVFWVLKK